MAKLCIKQSSTEKGNRIMKRISGSLPPKIFQLSTLIGELFKKIAIKSYFVIRHCKRMILINFMIFSCFELIGGVSL